MHLFQMFLESEKTESYWYAAKAERKVSSHCYAGLLRPFETLPNVNES